MLALLSLYRRRGDSLKAAQLMVRAEAHTSNALEKTRLLYEAGKIFQEKLGDEAKAAELFARTLELDPEHVEAAEPLSEIYFKREEWAPLVPILEMLVRKAERRPNRELTLLLLPAGQGGRPAGRRREGAEVLQAGLRPRLDPPADAARSRGAALPPRAVGRRLQALPDHPGPPPRRPEGRRTSSRSSTASGRSS